MKIPFLQENIIKLSKIFDIKLVSYFLDKGQDDTLGEIKRASESRPDVLSSSIVKVIINHEQPLPSRTQRIAFGRNTLFNLVSKEYPDVDYFIMMDGDNISSATTLPKILSDNDATTSPSFITAETWIKFSVPQSSSLIIQSCATSTNLLVK